MTSVLPMHIVGVSEKAIGEYRDTVAPLIKNNWNRLRDFLFSSRAGLAICIASFVLFFVAMLSGNWLDQYIPHGIVLLFAAPLIFIFGVSKLSEDFVARAPVWFSCSVMEYMAKLQPSAAEVQVINDMIDLARKEDPSVEFEVEYLQAGTKKRPLPRVAVLWENSRPLKAKRKFARLVLQDGKPVDLHELAHQPIVLK